MIHAYSDLYLDSAQDILGHAFDWVANTCDKDLSEFCKVLAKSRIGHMFEIGYPRYVAGCNGAELVNFILEDIGLPIYDDPHEFYADKSPEYWAGWALAYFQWKYDLTFADIFYCVSIDQVLSLYPTGHERDIRSVADILMDLMQKGKLQRETE